MMPRFRLFFIVALLFLVSILYSLCTGSINIPFNQLLSGQANQFNTIFFTLRLPRTLTAFICGSLLALAGSLMQLLLQNPLADPYVLGVSSGAAFVTLLCMLLGLGEFAFLAGAWGGSILTMLFILFLARKHHWQSHALLLSGIAIACGLSASISTLLLVSPDTTLRSMLFWLSGDLNDARFSWLAFFILIIGFTICMFMSPGLDLLGRGEKEARALGLSTRYYRLALYLLSSLFTATAVTLAGCIGFIGLIVPHTTRLLTGHRHHLLLPVTALLGGTLLTIADTLARSLFAPQQLPVGILMALIGVPAFIWLMQHDTSR